MEENKNVVQEQQYYEKPRSNKGLIIGLIVTIVVIAVGLLIYAYLEPAAKKDDNKKEEPLSIVKDSLNKANSFWGDFDSSHCSADDTIDDFNCYYDSEEGFKSKFYSVYSKELEYKDVFLDYSLYPKDNDTSSDAYKSREGYAHETGYKIENNKIYIDNMCGASGSNMQEIIDYQINSANDEKIEFQYKYKYVDYDLEKGEDVERLENNSGILVKEDGKWKIYKATVVEKCGLSKKVGKQSEEDPIDNPTPIPTVSSTPIPTTKPTSMPTITPTPKPAITPTAKPTTNDTFTYAGENGEYSYGYAIVKGYIEVKKNEKYCVNAGCAAGAITTNDAVIFHFVSTNSENFKKVFIDGWWSNSDGKIIRMGCLNNDKITYKTYADEYGGMSNPMTLSLSKDLTKKLLASNANNPISLKLTKKKMTEFTGIGEQCESKLTIIEEG